MTNNQSPDMPEEIYAHRTGPDSGQWINVTFTQNPDVKYIRADLIKPAVPREVIEKAIKALEISAGYVALVASGVDKMPISKRRAYDDCDILGDAINALKPYVEGKE